MGKGVQLYGDRWKLNFGGEHFVGYTAVEIKCCSHESYKML